MKWIKTALAGCVSLLAMTAHANAATAFFMNIGFALWSGTALGAVFTPTIIAAGLQIAAYGAVLGAQLALSQRQQPKINPGELKNTFQEAETPEYNGVGRVRVGGLKAFGNTKGNTISRLIWHLRGPMVAVEEYFVGGRSVIVEDNGRVSSPPWVRGSSNSYLRIWTKPGDGSETAWTQLRNDFPDLWTPAHRCRGIFQSLARYVTPNLDSESGNKKFQKLYQGGPPDINITARVTPVYDPRDPAQDPDDETTWKWTDNGILCAVHIMRRYPDLRSSDFDWAFIAQEADRADVQVATLNGIEPRARCWGIWPSESRRGEVMQQVLDSIGAEVVVSREGLIRLRLIDDAPEPEMHFPTKHVHELNWKAGPEAVERPNVCRIKYYSPERGYDMGEIDLTTAPWARVEDEIARYGEKVFDVDLPFCPSASQAQRIGRRLFLQARADAGDIKTNMVGMMAWGTTYASIEDEDADETMLCRIASPRADSKTGEVGIPYIVWPQDLIDEPWNPATMEAPPPDEAPDLQYESDLPDPSQPNGATVVRYPNGNYETRTWFGGVSGGSIAEARFRVYTDGNPELWRSMTEYRGESGGWLAYDAYDSRGRRADFRSQFFNGQDEGSYPSPTLTVDPMSINNTPTGAPEVSAIGEDIDPSNFQMTWRVVMPEARGVRIVIETRSGVFSPSWGIVREFNVARPDRVYEEVVDYNKSPDPISVDYRVSTYTSDGTRGTYATGSFNIPPGN